MDGDLGFDPPPGWTAGEVAQVSLAAGSDVTVDRWSAWRAPDGPGKAVSGCFGADLDAWIDEATPVILERLAATAGSVASGIDPGMGGLRVVNEARTSTAAGQILARTGDPERRAVARTILGFTSAARGGERARGCFVVCAPTTVDCERALSAAMPGGFLPPPPAGVIAQGLAYGVRHPRAALAGGACLFLLAGVVAVWTRPRARRRPR